MEYKWKLEWLPEAVAMEINTTASHLLPEDAQRSLEYYKSMQPDDNSLRAATDQTVNPLWPSLNKKQVVRFSCVYDCLRALIEGVPKRSGVRQSIGNAVP